MIKKIKAICQLYGIKPQRDKGQNFLINQEVIEKIIAAAGILPEDIILEVGPGLGILTEALIKKAKKVLSIELDKNLFDFLKIKFKGAGNLELINQDILKWRTTNSNAFDLNYKIVANLPYNITSIFLREFLSKDPKPSAMILLLQKEVAERICCQAGKMSLLAVSVQLYGSPEIIDLVPNSDFWPEPQVNSAILKISNIKSDKEVDVYLGDISVKQFWRVVKVGFSARRKQLSNNLAAGLKVEQKLVKNILTGMNIDSDVRAQRLSVDDWLALAKNLRIYLN